MDAITLQDFKKIDIRLGKIIKAEDVVESDKLIKFTVDFGELGTRTIFAGIRKWYQATSLEGKLLPFLINIEPKKFKLAKDGEEVEEESQGMLIAAGEDECIILEPDHETKPGTPVR